MKKIVLCFVLLIVLGVFFACDNPGNSSDPGTLTPPGSGGSSLINLNTPPTLISEDRGGGDSLALGDWPMELPGQGGPITGGGEVPMFPNHLVSVISSKTEVNYKMPTYLQTNEFWELKDNYGEDFFENNFLVVISFVEISGSITHSVEGVFDNGDIVINRFSPEIGNSALKLWNIVIELEKNDNLKATEFKAVFTGDL